MEIYKERNFNSVFSDSFAFIRQNFKAIALSFLIICGPILFIRAISVYFVMQQTINVNFLLTGGSSFSVWSIISAISGVAVFMINLGIVAEMYLLHHQNPNEPLTYQHIWDALKKDIGRLFSTFLWFMLFGLLVGVAFAIIFLLFGFLLGGVPVVGAILMFLLFIGLLLVFPNLMFISTAVYIARLQNKNISFSEALGLAYRLNMENYWTTWVTMFVASLLIFVVLGIGSFVIGIITLTASFNTATLSYDSESATLISILSIFLEVIYNFIYLIFYAISALWFFSLYEKKFAVGMQQKLDTIGKNEPDTDSENPLII